VNSGPDISALVVNWNTRELVMGCLDSIGAGVGKGVSFEIIVVDNGSADGSVDLVRERFPQVKVVELERNEGFAGGVSRGIAAARGEWIAVFNNDTTVEPDCVTVMLDAARLHPRVGAVAAQMRFADRRTVLNSAGLELDRLGIAADRLVGLPVATEADHSPYEVFGATGGAALFKREMLDQVGGFDESFFMYGEDADLCARLREAGWGVDLCRTARFVHVGGGSSRSEPEGMRLELLRSWLRLIAKLRGTREAERARRWLLRAMRVRGLTSREPGYRKLASWLGSGRVGELLGLPE
jgi:GT2 family glycosyltransferase